MFQWLTYFYNLGQDALLAASMQQGGLIHLWDQVATVKPMLMRAVSPAGASWGCRRWCACRRAEWHHNWSPEDVPREWNRPAPDRMR